MTIYYDFEMVTETRTDEDGIEYQTELRGPLQVWFFDSDPATDPPDQTFDWRSAETHLTWSNDEYPVEVKSECVLSEMLDAYPARSQRVFRIIAEAAMEDIQMLE